MNNMNTYCISHASPRHIRHFYQAYKALIKLYTHAAWNIIGLTNVYHTTSTICLLQFQYKRLHRFV
jgi:hypothetical protein